LAIIREEDTRERDNDDDDDDDDYVDDDYDDDDEMMTMTTTTMTATTMTRTTTKQQSTVGNNWGSRIGEKRRLGGVGWRRRATGEAIWWSFSSSTKSFPDPHSAPPGAGEGPELIPHVSWA
jgi:hypothetical protein